MKNRNKRQEQIRELVRTKPIKTQHMLAEELKALGFVCTQATISRDIADLQLKKNSSGYYVLAEDLHLKRMVIDLVEEICHTGNLVLIKAAPGTAPGVAAALDDAGLTKVMGSVAGDDTVLVICESETLALEFIADINQMLKEGRAHLS